MAKDLRLVILSKSRVVAVLAVLLFVVAGLVVGATQNRPPTGNRGGPPTGAIPVPVVLLLGLAGPAVAVVAIHDTNQREVARLEHEKETRLRDERREAYLAYMAVCDRLHGGDHSPEARAELRKIVEVVELVSLSREVQDSVRALTNHLIIRTMRGKTKTVSTRDESAYRVLLEKFKKAIRRDLGITPLRT